MSNTFVGGVITAVGAISAYMYFESRTAEVTYVSSKVDGKKYLVQNKLDKQEAADLLANVTNKLIKLCDYLEVQYPDNKDVKRLCKNFNPESIAETSYKNKYTSYSINKGEKVIFCLRSRDGKDELVEENILMFVALHEMAHLMTKTIGHDDNFWNNFRFLLKNAIDIGIYKYVDFDKNPTGYCGIEITSSPL